jgi:peptide/nickel transport system permease protein
LRTRLSSIGRPIGNLLVLLFGISTLMFFALRAAGDPVAVLAGEDASPELIEAIRARYGFDQPLPLQYFFYLGNLLRLDFGDSLATGQPALAYVFSQLPATLLLAFLGMTVTLLVAIPAGAWLGLRPDAPERRLAAGSVFFMQGVPGFVLALILIQIFVIRLEWLPSLGFADPRTWILPSVALASFLAPKLIRVISANVAEAMREDYIRTARANGASARELLWREALPNALLGATALIGTQFAFLLSGVVIIELLFYWPGLGLLLLRSSRTLDFPVLQALAFVVALLVFSVNGLTNFAFRLLDPRLR